MSAAATSRGPASLAKFLLLIALAIVVYLLFRGFAVMPASRIPSDAPRPGTGQAPEDMVRCAVCGVHLPRSESFTSRGQVLLHRRAPPPRGCREPGKH